MRRTLSVRADSTKFEFGIDTLSFSHRRLRIETFCGPNPLFISVSLRVGLFGRRLALFGVC